MGFCLILCGDLLQRGFLPLDFLPQIPFKDRLGDLLRQDRAILTGNARVILHSRQRSAGVNQVRYGERPELLYLRFSIWEETNLTLRNPLLIAHFIIAPCLLAGRSGKHSGKKPRILSEIMKSMVRFTHLCMAD